MKFLGIETSGPNTGGVIFFTDQEIVLKKESTQHRSFAEILNSFIDEGLLQLGWSLKDLSAIVVDYGPGSFTGIRIGVSLAKTFSFVLNIPVVTVSSLEILLQESLLLPSLIPQEHQRIALINAYQGFYFSQKLLCRNSKFIFETETCLNLDQLQAQLDQPTVFLGADALLIQQQLLEKVQDPTKVLFQSEISNPKLEILSRLGIAAFQNQKINSYSTVKPLYLRRSSAEEKYRNP